MSNPGVITLTEIRLKSSAGFRVEDNLCESIHFHYKDIRIDLTIKELLSIATTCEQSIYDLVPAKNFVLSEYPCDFLENNAARFIDLIEIKDECIPVSSLFVQKQGKHIVTYKKMNKALAATLQKEKKSDGENYVVLFNDTSIVISGEHIVADAWSKGTDAVISVRRFIFNEGKHSPEKHPVFAFFFKWDNKRIFSLAKRIARKVL